MRGPGEKEIPAMNRAAKNSYIVMCLGALVLTATGVAETFFGNPPMTHWKLMIHISAAPVFALGLAAVALSWAEVCRQGAGPRLGPVARALFWIVLTCGLVVMLTGVLPMTPFFGTRGERWLYLTHRYAGITMAGMIVLHLVAIFAQRGKTKGKDGLPGPD